MTEPERVDWAEIWRDLEANGITTYALAKRRGWQFGQAQRLVKRLRRGGEPRDTTAIFLRRLHAEKVPGSRFANVSR